MRLKLDADQVRLIVTTMTDDSVAHDVEFIDSEEQASMVVSCTDEDQANDLINYATISGLCQQVDTVYTVH